MKNCLIVDDSRAIRKVACRILEELRFATEEAEDGAAALDICRRQMPDLILLDWNLPNANGAEFVRSLRRERHGNTPVVVFWTTEHDVGHVAEALGAGANEFLMKPFDRGMMEAKLAEVGLLG